MNINRNNYQEFLLLYIDGELSTEVEQEVDAFLELHLDIKQEFDDLLNTKLQLEEVSFGDVSSLLKFEEKSIGLNNYQEKFLLYVDNELSNQEKQSVETFVLQHPTLQSSFTTLKNTVLPLETIQHPNKKELHKKERKPIIFYLQRISVAAAFIGFVAFIWNLNSPKATTEITTIQSNKVVNSTNSTATNKDAEKNIVKENAVIATNTKEVKNSNTIIVKSTQPEKQKIENNLVATVTKNARQPLTNQSNIAQNNHPQTNNTQTLFTNNTIANNSSVNNNIIPATLAVNNTTNNTQNSNNYTAKQVVYKSLDGDDENSKSILVAGEEIKASKLMGLFKKVMKVITPKESDDSDSKKLFAVTL
jgi:hypothetical protein